MGSNATYIPRDNDLDIYIGNSRSKNLGSQGTLLKGVRVWGVYKSVDFLTLWKHRQVNPRWYSTSELLAYVRLNEGNYNLYNYESIANSMVTADVWAEGIAYDYDRDLLICPQ